MLGSRQPRSRSIASGPRCAARRMALLLLSGLSLASIMPAITMAQDLGADRPSPRDPYGDHIAEASRRFGVPIAWIRAVMRAESAGDPRALSPKGAMGL
ncbi:MAG: transglycosylase SLT domain-containing protein, partial [Alphaproteobacteria bacterium]|nr:transglycosylase SLT domain-containing protein [Alphaproteobacteria bacterium]